MRISPAFVLAAGLLLNTAVHAGFVPHRSPPAAPQPAASAKVKNGIAAVAGAVKRAGRNTQRALRRLAAQHHGQGRFMPPLAGDRPTFD